MDLIAEGNLGLCEAVERFDVDRGYHFITYAVWWIKQAILKALSEKSRMIRLPFNRANQLLHIEKIRREIVKSGEKEPDFEKIARYLDLDKEYVRTLINMSRDVLSLEKPLSPKGDGAAIAELMEDDKAESPEMVTVNRTLRESIDEVLSTLNEREAEIILLRFGLRGDRPLSLKEIGERYDLTKERIRQIEKGALKRLRHPKRIRRLVNFDRG
jgi:RNA polymerase primary sigma factor